MKLSEVDPKYIRTIYKKNFPTELSIQVMETKGKCILFRENSGMSVDSTILAVEFVEKHYLDDLDRSKNNEALKYAIEHKCFVDDVQLHKDQVMNENGQLVASAKFNYHYLSHRNAILKSYQDDIDLGCTIIGVFAD